MSENDTETAGISDDQLPPDLVPSEDNPLAEGRPSGEDSDVLDEGKRADEMPDPDDAEDS
ncbi:hypothetical protein I601_3806 [Nocardioides dokdonensis FR1436]|uniref:Uncharacterized protein n=1 Tax=Nocardioides dokdonensis FR1436 TaxID=1300347 RepID=A0A1A9GRT6_9ACTN|nr:hypothetical protein [Nocardioides dokdonensis]ANH40205.1 hypothetical protein I601_3806 [Nocardioides dokdonensis FR1436]